MGPYLMGFTTSYRMGQLLRYSLTVGEPDTWDVDRFMATTFIDAVRECLSKGGYARTEDGQEQGGQFLVGIHGQVAVSGRQRAVMALAAAAELTEGVRPPFTVVQSE